MALLIGIGGAAGEGAGGGQERFQSLVESASSMPSSLQDLRDRANQAIGILAGERGEEFEEPPIRFDVAENFRVLHLAGHHDLRQAFGVADFDQAAEFAQRDPIEFRSEAFEIGRGFFADGDDDGLIAHATGGFECEDREAAISRNDAVFQ